MAITPTTGSAANSASAASLALPQFTLTAGQDVVVAVALGYTGSEAVTGITDTKGNIYALKQAVNGTGVRTEIWESHNVGAQVNNIITIAVSPNTDIAGAAEEYAGTFNTTFGALNPSGWVATADGYYGGGYEPAKSIDGNTATIWASANSALPHYLSIDMGAAHAFNMLRLISRQDGSFGQNPTTIELYVSDDGISWGAAVETETGMSGVAAYDITWTLSTTYTHRYFRIKVTAVGSGSISSIAEVYVGNTASIPSQNTGSNLGSNTYPYQMVTTQCGNNFQVTAIGFAAQAGDTLTAQVGTSRQSSIPAAARSGVALYDNTMVGDGQVVVETRISTARNWATAGLELQVVSGVAVTYVDYAATTAPALQVAKDVRYLRVLMPPGGGSGSGGGGAWPFMA